MTLSAQLPGANEGCGVIETRKRVEVNAPPVPAIAAPERIAAGAAVLFDASASSDPDGAITGFDWDWGDGSTRERRAGAAPLRGAGSYTVRLATTDDAGVGNSRVGAGEGRWWSRRRRWRGWRRRCRSAPASRMPGPWRGMRRN